MPQARTVSFNPFLKLLTLYTKTEIMSSGFYIFFVAFVNPLKILQRNLFFPLMSDFHLQPSKSPVAFLTLRIYYSLSVNI